MKYLYAIACLLLCLSSDPWTALTSMKFLLHQSDVPTHAER